MNIKIKSITLRNFKGLRDVSFDFDGRNATIIGDNGTGKTTIFDALTWVLFGKDSHNSTDIDIKTIDATGEPMHRAEHFVEVALDVDGSRTDAAPHVPRDLEQAARVVRPAIRRTRKCVCRQWRGGRNQGGIRQNHFGMDQRQCIPDADRPDVFQYSRRLESAVPLALVGDNIDRTAIQAQLPTLLAEMNGEPSADFKARLATESARTKKELETLAQRSKHIKTRCPAGAYARWNEITLARIVTATEIAAYQRQIDSPRHADRRRIEK